MEKKIDIARKNIYNYIDFLRCPLCQSSFLPYETGYFVKCKNNHSYDLAKKGYVNLFNGYTKITKTYDKILFSARKIISDSGLYKNLCEKICGIINPGIILDAGCGCGNLTVDIFEKTGKNLTFAVDLSKDGIDFASGNFCENNLIWIVGNLNNLPLENNTIDIILNIMSPANYAEFNRVLKPDGILLKVLPDADYLKELRNFIYKENDKNNYSNEEVLANLEENSGNIYIKDIIDVKYTHEVSGENIPALFDMTPLTLNIAEREKIRDELINFNNFFKVTLAFKIALCVKK